MLIPRKPRWYECNILAREGIKKPKQWEVLKSNRSRVIFRNKKTGAVREVVLEDQAEPKYKQDMVSERLARQMRKNRGGLIYDEDQNRAGKWRPV